MCPDEICDVLGVDGGEVRNSPEPKSGMREKKKKRRTFMKSCPSSESNFSIPGAIGSRMVYKRKE